MPVVRANPKNKLRQRWSTPSSESEGSWSPVDILYLRQSTSWWETQEELISLSTTNDGS